MKPFDPEFSLRAYFQVKYRDVIDVRASKLIPYLSLHDPHYIETTRTVPRPGSDGPLESNWYREAVLSLDSAESSTVSTQAASETSCSTEEPLKISPNSAKRQMPSTEDHVTRRSSSDSPRKAVKIKLGARQGKSERPATAQWAKSVIVRLQPRPDQVVQDLLYTFVRLPAPDVEDCAAAICAKMNIPFTKGMPISWFDSKTSLRGPFNHAFLQGMPDMQDFVVSVQTLGRDGNVGLLLEM